MQQISIQQVMPQASPLSAVMSEAMPCDNCPHRRCNNENLACWDYAHYLDKGTVRKRHREPSQHIYLQVMSA